MSASGNEKIAKECFSGCTERDARGNFQLLLDRVEEKITKALDAKDAALRAEVKALQEQKKLYAEGEEDFAKENESLTKERDEAINEYAETVGMLNEQNKKISSLELRLKECREALEAISKDGYWNYPVKESGVSRDKEWMPTSPALIAKKALQGGGE